MPLRPSRTVLRALPLALLALGACHSLPAPRDTDEERLYGEVFSDIARYHMDETRPDRLARAALRGLKTIDPSLSVSEAEGVVYLRDGYGEDAFTAPREDDTTRWGTLTARVVAAARLASPTLAEIEPDRVDERVLDAALASLDRFSRYVRPEAARERRAERDGFVGVGVTLDIAPPSVRVASVMPGTPADTAGLEVGDGLVAVDGRRLARLSADDIRDLLDGPKDSAVAIEIARPGRPDDFTVAMRRAHIVPDTVSLAETANVAVLTVTDFNQRTALSTALLLAKAHQDMGPALRGVVLDLRSDPGGLLQQSIELASLFLEKGLVAATIGRVPESLQTFPVSIEAGPPERLPLVVLVNGGTASAAEVVASALQDSGRAVVIGTASFGKGTVQTVLRTGNGGELSVTWAQLITPGGYRLHRHGVVPTICTSGLAAAPEGAALTLASAPASLEVARNRLDDAGWENLRDRCPARRERSALDLDLAERVVLRPALYHEALLRTPDESRQESEARLP